MFTYQLSLSVTNEEGCDVLNLFRNFSISRVQFLSIILALFWLAGVSAGCFISRINPLIFDSMMRSACKSGVSIVWLTLMTLVPLFVVSAAVYFRLHFLIYPLCAIRAFCFSVCFTGIYIAFGSAGWLVRSLLQMSDFFLIPVLLWFSLYSLAKNRSKQVTVCCISYAALIGMLDYCVISPFLADLINSYETMGRYAIHVGLDWCL